MTDDQLSDRLEMARAELIRRESPDIHAALDAELRAMTDEELNSEIAVMQDEHGNRSREIQHTIRGIVRDQVAGN
jgi:hypothetical protein